MEISHEWKLTIQYVFLAYQQDPIHCVASDHLLPHTESEDLEPMGDGFVAELMLMVTFVGPFGFWLINHCYFDEMGGSWVRGNLSNEIKDDESRLLIQLVSTHYTEYILFLVENNISNVFVHSNESLPYPF